MAISYPTSLDTLTNPTATDKRNSPSHALQHANANDAIEAKVGIDSSAVATSLDYLLKNTSSSNPGHKHTLANGATDVTKTAAQLNAVDPSGALIMWAGSSSTPPTGWLVCDGTAISRTTYSGLYAVIGTTFGTGDGSTTFNLPDMRDRFVVGAGTTYSRNDKGGAATANLAHTHTTGDHALTTAELASHSHAPGGDATLFLTDGTTAVSPALGTGSAYAKRTATGTAGSGTAHNHGATGSGGSSTQSILPPYIGIYFIIKT